MEINSTILLASRMEAARTVAYIFLPLACFFILGHRTSRQFGRRPRSTVVTLAFIVLFNLIVAGLSLLILVAAFGLHADIFDVSQEWGLAPVVYAVCNCVSLVTCLYLARVAARKWGRIDNS